MQMCLVIVEMCLVIVDGCIWKVEKIRSRSRILNTRNVLFWTGHVNLAVPKFIMRTGDGRSRNSLDDVRRKRGGSHKQAEEHKTTTTTSISQSRIPPPLGHSLHHITSLLCLANCFICCLPLCELYHNHLRGYGCAFLIVPVTFIRPSTSPTPLRDNTLLPQCRLRSILRSWASTVCRYTALQSI